MKGPAFASRTQAVQVSRALVLVLTDYYFCIQGPGSNLRGHQQTRQSFGGPIRSFVDEQMKFETRPLTIFLSRDEKGKKQA